MNNTHQTLYEWTPQGVTTHKGALPPEILLCIHINGKELLRIAATPILQEALVAGFLYYSNVIQSRDEIKVLRQNDEGTCVDVWLSHEVETGTLKNPLLTSGCGMGVILGDLYQLAAPLKNPLHIEPQDLANMMTELHIKAELYQKTQGIHASALFTPEGKLLVLAEDVGRHNTVDKILGTCLLQGIPTGGTILLTTGRVSSEMISKAAKLRTPIVGSLTALTSTAVAFAEKWKITGVGYIRNTKMRIYTHPQRIL
ncbi:MAG: formate dehydrogenase accessory sulfurtransferase FdhD [Anaerolineae bacterium]|nr:formate dehydrogenase accessory sulfurtransferase FdhD [Anaerolineae bacterium]